MLSQKLKDRYTITLIAFFIVITIITFRLASIMIVEGENYRELAENRIFKSIPLTAPRGEIRDRYGRLLAGNRPSFTVQFIKNEVVEDKINDVALEIIKTLEANNDRYIDEFPIILDESQKYIFTYDEEIEEWKKDNNLQDAKNAAEAFFLLGEAFDVPEIENWMADYNLQEIDKAAETFSVWVNDENHQEAASELGLKAQQQLLQYLTVPISIRTWKYTEEMKKENWLQSHKIDDFNITAEEAFLKVKEDIYKIPEDFSNEDARKIMVVKEQLSKPGYLQYHPIRIAQDVSHQSVVQIEENIMDLPGINVAVEPIRYYPEGETAAHILGTLGKISQQSEIDKYINELGYFPGDIIGKTGIEQKFEEYLKGKDGYEKVVVDSKGRLIEVLEKVEPIPGNTLHLTIDINIQKKAEEVLKEVLYTVQEGGVYETKWGKDKLAGTDGPKKNATSGSTVVTDVNTGQLLALANYPSYDPNLFATGISMMDWQSLMPENERDPLAPRPLTNIALSTAVQPGSTYKMLVGLAALEQGLSPNYKILDKGFIQVGGHSFGNWRWNMYRTTAGYQDLYKAIADSNNYYFYSLGTGYDYGANRPLPVPMNVETMIDYTNRFGLNDRTGIEIDIPRERSGGVPSLENKTSTIKALLKRHLTRLITIDDLDGTVVALKKESIEELITRIIDWTEENPSRGELYNRLVEQGIKADKANLFTDIIKYNYYIQARWSIADTMNFSIGQGEHSYTPIQMNSYMMTLANGGYRYKTTLLDKIQSNDGEIIKENSPKLIERVQLKDYDNLNHIHRGMYEVSTGIGTARNYFKRFPIEVAVKTGTAQRSGKIPPIDEVEYLQRHFRNFGVTEEAVEAKMDELRQEDSSNSKYKDDAYVMREAIKKLNPRLKNIDLDSYKEDYDNYAWFTGFAPYKDPEIAISVLIFQGGSGGYGAPIFREIVAEYMGLNIDDNNKNKDFMGNYMTR
ncbi:penicillin-binding protein [Alkaliphilus pronyensis]|uniref:Penicillin-binding protein n=1 Tax=Alkaliphilus pronyensis TaxID=1482732 RepID=A0A6I0FAW6_9FIRM|nr:penicillin-binding transpeptidase domain-containing protein [Alkaliphilus pronyensis]KAB3535913.1 penicillin-binding protein [Alkaliphilus pronyensis]